MKNNWIIWGLLGLLVLAAPACKDDDAKVDESQVFRERLEKQIGEIEAHLQQNNITAEKDARGIFREVIQPAPEGQLVEEGDLAIVQYKITQLDGTLIAASDAAKPARITYSYKRAYFPAALRFGLENVRVGGSYRYYVPSAYGFRNYSDEQIPENAIIILEYKVVDVYNSLEEVFEAEQQDIQAWLQAENKSAEELPGGLHKIVLTEGSGEMPVSGDTAKVYYKGYFLNKEVFDEKLSGDTFNFRLGTSSVVRGFEQAVSSMQVGEKSLFILPSELAYGSGSPRFVGDKGAIFVQPVEKRKSFQEAGLLPGYSPIPPFSTLIFEIELKEIK